MGQNPAPPSALVCLLSRWRSRRAGAPSSGHAAALAVGGPGCVRTPIAGHRAPFQMSGRTGSVIMSGQRDVPSRFSAAALVPTAAITFHTAGGITTHVRNGELMRSFLTGNATAAALLVAAAVAAQAAGQTCESLASLVLPNTTITLARAVDAGALTIPIAAGGTPPPTALVQAASGLPAFCRVAARLKPSTDSDIKIEVWMPASGWNGKFMAVGNSGLGARSITRTWSRFSSEGMPWPRPILATIALARSHAGRWGTRKNKSISATVPFTR